MRRVSFSGLKFDVVRDFEVNAGAPPGTVVGRLRASQGTGVAAEDLVYSLHNSSDHAYFQLDSKTALLSTIRLGSPFTADCLFSC